MITHVDIFNRPCVLIVTLQVKEPCILRIRGYDPKKENTFYFNRTKGNAQRKVSNKKPIKMCFPLPVAPEYLHVEAFAKDQIGDIVEIKEIELKRINRYEPRIKRRGEPAPIGHENFLWLSEDEFAFLKFAIEFAKKAGYISAGVYQDDAERYSIVYENEIRNTQTGQPETTPARISRKNGVIEINRKKFIEFTVPMRVMILLHEFMHWRLKTRVELECDFNAINVFLKYGFSKTEAMYAFTKVFDGQDRLTERTNEIVNFIENFEDLNCV